MRYLIILSLLLFDESALAQSSTPLQLQELDTVYQNSGIFLANDSSNVIIPGMVPQEVRPDTKTAKSEDSDLEQGIYPDGYLSENGTKHHIRIVRPDLTSSSSILQLEIDTSIEYSIRALTSRDVR